MRKLIYYVHSSIDGYIEGPNGEFDWPLMGPELSAYSLAMDETVDTFLYGRVVWEMMSGFWPQAESTSDDPHDLAFAPVWRATPKVVFSRTLTSADWNATVVGGDLVGTVDALKKRDGKDLLLSGGSSLAGSLASLGLIDDYRVVVHPVVLGGGKRLLPVDGRVGLSLAESRTFDGTTVLVRYTT